MSEIAKETMSGKATKIYGKSDLVISGNVITIPDGKTFSDIKALMFGGPDSGGYGGGFGYLSPDRYIHWYYKVASMGSSITIAANATTINLGSLSWAPTAITEILMAI